MSIHEQIKKDKIKALKNGDKKLKNSLSFIIGEFQRLKGTKDQKDKIGDILTDDQAIKVLKSLKATEVDIIEKYRKDDTSFLDVLNMYIPEEISIEELEDWISENIDFSKLKNKMQAVGIIKKEFGPRVDGTLAHVLVSQREV